MVDEIEVYVDLTDFQHEIGEGNAPGPHSVYNTLQEIRKKQPCVYGCGVIKAKLVFVEVVQDSNFNNVNKNHKLFFSEKYRLMEEALLEIKTKNENEDIKKIIQNVLDKIKDD